MECLRCGKESKYEFCRECKKCKHNAGAIVSQNKSKLKDLLNENILQPELFARFILYTDNIIKHWKIYMEYKSKKQEKIFRFISWWMIACSIMIWIWSVASLIILKI
jgi:hypothetical protein